MYDSNPVQVNIQGDNVTILQSLFGDKAKTGSSAQSVNEATAWKGVQTGCVYSISLVTDTCVASVEKQSQQTSGRNHR